jgi:dimethylglycine dehydrogenase
LVNAAGSFARQVGAWVCLDVPLVNMVHQYLVTEPIPEVAALERETPVIRDPRASCYYRQEQKGLIIGPYETAGAQAWGLDGIDWSFDMQLLPPDIDRLTPWLELVMERIPVFAEAGIRRVVNGPITHSPDGTFLLGPAAGLRNYWMCCGASIGITQGPGAGWALAQWMVHGQAEVNVRELDPRRFGPYAKQPYCVAKAIDEYQRMYATHYPGEVRDPGRPARTSTLYEPLKAKGAIYAEAFGWERPKWFAPAGVTEVYSFRRTNWFSYVAEECRAVRERVGVLDLSSFSKYEVTGTDAEAMLNRLFANRMPRRDGGIVLAHMLTADGMIESESTITRLSEGRYYLLSGAVAQLHDLDLLCQGVREGEDVTVVDVTDDIGVLVLAGPQSRAVLAGLTDADLSNAAFRWLAGREITVAGVPLRALRISYVGELGWELHAPMDALPRLYGALMEAGAGHGIADFGVYAVNALRMEKAHKAWGAELTNEITMVEADMMRFVDLEKGDFVGRDALLRRQEEGVKTTLVYAEVEDGDADPLGNEPVFDGDRVIGVTTGGAHGHAVGKTLVFAYVEPALAEPGSRFEVAILGRRRPASVLSEPAYDAANVRMRA